MLFVVCMVVLGVTYPMLTLGNPGKVTEDTPKVCLCACSWVGNARPCQSDCEGRY